jgi:gliding motility-associated-like protein
MKSFGKKLLSSIGKSLLPIFFLVNLLLPKITTASHVSGGDISFQCIGPNTYQITLNLFRDCSGIAMSNTEFVDAVSTCGGTANITMNLSNINGTNISQLCPTDSLNSTCFGGTLPGMQLYTYTGIIVLAPPCDTWTLSWSTCCRNNTINVPSSSSDDIYIQTTLNTVTAPCNNSPIFTSQPIPYVCANQTVNYNFGVTEPDGDSLSFQFISAMQMGAAPLTYAGGYSGTTPITGITIDPVTGQITFIPTIQGNFIVVVQCNEYNSQGQLISTTMRDIQFVVLACSNTVPDLSSGQITNLVGNAVQTGPNSVDICEGNTFSFTATYTDPNAQDSLFVNTNIGIVLPGSTYTVSGFNPLTIVYTWTVPPGSAGTNTTFIVQIEDNACPITGMQTFVYDINVLDRTLAYPNQTICGNQSAILNASGGSVFTWKDLSGNVIPVSPQFSCNPCSTPIVTPLVTTTYVVESNLVGSCINSDTVTVTVVPDFSFTITSSQASACLLQPVQLQAIVNPPGVYNYLWLPQSVMNNSTIQNPIANFTQSGSYTVDLAVQSPFGCVKQDNIQINISANVAPVVSIISDTVCLGNSNQLQVEFAGVADPTQYTYQWFNPNNVSDPTILNPTTTINYDTTYTVVVTAINGGCSDTAQIIINNLNNPSTVQINFPLSFTYCLNDPAITLTASSPGGLWSGNGIDPVTGVFTPLIAGVGNHEIIYIISGSAQCESRDTIYLDVTGSPNAMINYVGPTDVCISNLPINLIPQVPGGTWFGQGVDPLTGVFTPSIAGVGNHVITYSLGTGNCTDIDQITFNVFPLMNDSITSFTTLCENDQPLVLFSSTIGGTWSGQGVTNNPVPIFEPQLSGDGLFILTYTYSGICSFTSTTSINVNPPPPTPIIVNNSPICENQQLDFTTTTIQNAQWIWTGPNGFVSNLQNPQIISTNIQDSGRYTCVVNVNGCSSDPVYSDVIIYPTPDQPQIYSNSPVCEGENLVIFTDPQANSTFFWSGPNGFSTSDREFTIGYATPASSGIYEIIALSNGCISPINSISVVVNPNPTVSFLADPSITDILSPQILFINSSSPGQYYWNFGDGSTSISFNPSHTYLDTGTYVVNLTVTNTQTTCVSSASQNVIIEPHFRMFIPSSFTPNGDGLNDNFKVHIEYFNSFEMNIYNRWGEIMFKCSDPEQLWNGKINNLDCQQGVYPYQINVITLNGETKKVTGTLTILR